MADKRGGGSDGGTKGPKPPNPRPAGDKGKGIHPATPADSHKRRPHQENRRPKGES